MICYHYAQNYKNFSNAENQNSEYGGFSISILQSLIIEMLMKSNYSAI